MIVWPRHTLLPRVARSRAATPTISGAASLSGFRQAVASPAAAWRISFNAVPVITVAEEMIRRVLAGQIKGRATPILLPVHERPEFKSAGSGVAVSSPHDDTAPFSDGSLYVTAGSAAIVVGAAALGATSLTIRVVAGDPLRAGQHVSIGVRLYRIVSIESVDGDDHEVTIWPPARDDIADGADVELDDLVLKVRLADDLGLAVTSERGRFAHMTVSFIEDPT